MTTFTFFHTSSGTSSKFGKKLFFEEIGRPITSPSIYFVCVAKMGYPGTVCITTSPGLTKQSGNIDNADFDPIECNICVFAFNSTPN